MEVLVKNRWFGVIKHSLKLDYQRRICNILGYPGALRVWSHDNTVVQLITKITEWKENKLSCQIYEGGMRYFAGLTCDKGGLEN